MKKILGLDLGVSSIGWALITTDDNLKPNEILAMGSRIVPLSKDDNDQFIKGQAITKNADRTAMRSARKRLDRYQLRRNLLTQLLRKNNMLPENMNENVFTLWKLRADAADPSCKLSLPQIGRVLYHLNQKRGYKHVKSDSFSDNKLTEYITNVNSRYKELQATGKTIGQYFYQQLENGKINNNGKFYSTFRIKGSVYPRVAYVAEFDAIIEAQKVYYPDILTPELIDTLRNRIIFYQRPLRSCKHLVSLCEFEMKVFKTENGKITYGGPKVAPRTSPLAELCKIWESVNNLTLVNRNNEKYKFTLGERQALVDFMMNHENLRLADIQKILGITKKDGWYVGDAIRKGLQGNNTVVALSKALETLSVFEREKMLRFNLKYVNTGVYNIETGEELLMISDEIEKEPLYRLWHIVYSSRSREELAHTLEKHYGITDDEIIDNLYKLDFVKPGYSNKSNKFMRKLLPYLQQGMMYSEACNYIGVNHSTSLTKDQNAVRELLNTIPQLQKNELRQPVIEKILNQMINVVNAIVKEYGAIDEIRVELARELKQSKKERDDAYKRNNINERKNKIIADKIAQMGIRVSKSRIQKYKMWEETQHKCIYCDKIINLNEFLEGIDSEKEHIIPRSVLFDDSFSNKTCSCHDCNIAKGNKTGYDFVLGRGQIELDNYIERVDELFKKKAISRIKRDHLLWKYCDIPNDFIERQLRQTQYIAKKAVEILNQICRDVHVTSGGITDFLRHEWGYDEVLHTLNFLRYKEVGLTEIKIYENNGVKQEKEVIKDWTKRIDHRHHAVDALIVALTRQTYIQRLNTLNAQKEHEEMEKEVRITNKRWNEKRSLLQKWISLQPHFSVQEVMSKVDGILISFRACKRVTTPAKRVIYRKGKRIVVQTGLQVPRGSLSEQSVYGKVGNNYVIKYDLGDKFTPEFAGKIIDRNIQNIVIARLNAFGGDAKVAFVEPLYSDKYRSMQIRTIRCRANVSDKSVAAVKWDENGCPIGFAKLGNNHHVALYHDKNGNVQESVITFWEAVNRKQHGLPVIITNPTLMWNELINRDDVPQSLLENLPQDGWEFVTSMQVNEMFIMGMSDDAYYDAISLGNYQALNKYLFRVQKLSSNDYCFRYHIDTNVDDKFEGKVDAKLSMLMRKLIRCRSYSSFAKENPHKVKVNLLGQIVAYD